MSIKIDKEQASIMSHVVAKQFKISCPESDCQKCERHGGRCSCSEMVELLLASGYDRQHVNVDDPDIVCEMSKTIAVARGYGCGIAEQCSKCSCNLTVGCVPHEVAQTLYSDYYKKGVAK